MYDFSDVIVEEIPEEGVFSDIPASENDLDGFSDAQILVEDDFSDIEQNVDTSPDTDTLALSDEESTEDFPKMCYEELQLINAKLSDFDEAILQIGENQYILINQTDVHLRYTNYLLSFVVGALVIYSFFSKL